MCQWRGGWSYTQGPAVWIVHERYWDMTHLQLPGQRVSGEVAGPTPSALQCEDNMSLTNRFEQVVQL